MVSTGTHASPAGAHVSPHEQTEARAWLGRTEEGFHRAAALLMGCCADRMREDYRICQGPAADGPVRALLTAPATAFAIADLHMWMGETFVVMGRKDGRAPWRQIVDLPSAVERISRIVELAAVAVRGEGTITVPQIPYSLPGLDVCVDEGHGELHLTRSVDGWRSAQGVLRRLETFQLYGSTVLVDGDVPWITEPALMVRGGSVYGTRLSTVNWVWGAALREAADLIERALRDEGKMIADFAHTLVPVEVDGCVFNSWVNTVVPGAIYVTRIQRPFVLAELIVHEAAHIWLSEMDYVTRTTNEMHTDVRLDSPPRAHDRPAYAVLQDVVAHAWVSRFWRRLRESGTGAHSFLARMRCEQVDKLVSDGVQSLEQVREAISPYGWKLIELSRAA
jgi:hypothetical protein